jgi:hypothetical protein
MPLSTIGYMLVDCGVHFYAGLDISQPLLIQRV